MVDEQEERIPDVIPGADEGSAGAPVEGVAQPELDAVAGDVVAVASTPVYDLTSDDGIRAAREANPALAGYFERERKDAAQTAIDRRNAELRRDQGTTEVAQQYTRWVAEQVANGADPEEIGRQTPFYVKANHDSIRSDFARALLMQAAEHGDETAKGLLDTITGDPEEAIRVAQVALDASVRRARADERATVTAELEAKYAAKLEAELNASQVEARTAGLSNPPNVSGTPGMSGGVTWESIDKTYTDAEWGRLDPETRKTLSAQADAARFSGSRSA